MLNAGEEFVTVTGTPGIGKSVFYAYFFQRWRKEVKNTWVIATAYRNQKLVKATVFKESNEGEKLHRAEEAIDDVVEKAEREKKKIMLLCDGPPELFRGDTQMVVFTSPNVKWIKSVRKDICTLYMPLWTCEELQEAAFALGLAESSGITDEVVEARFNTFGGVARECFLPTRLCDDMQRELVTEIKQISDPGELENLCDGMPNREVCHRVLHYVPGDSKMWADTQLASPFVVEKVAQRMLRGVENNREKLRTALKGIPQGASLRGWLLETGVHEGLQRGCELKARLLQDNGTTGNSDNSDDQLQQTFQIAESHQPDEFKLKDLSPAAATRGPYHKPESDQFESIDGFYLPKMDSTEVTAPQLVVGTLLIS
ncbi:hypothetical protein PHYPSEUDO_015129 [Phytophthora pseudosyringae]|uniref:Uncharacterized protein n=1 Tax=Phytophthora pseudosyringae TaxID=221518 RepID=A0A8T1V8F4_9STRA|nr:hypothetical protein PHYPSEUDO_015129 [Phytophthora pseudosyringae]